MNDTNSSLDRSQCTSLAHDLVPRFIPLSRIVVWPVALPIDELVHGCSDDTDRTADMDCLELSFRHKVVNRAPSDSERMCRLGDLQ